MMKKLIFILFLLPVLAFGQNRFPSIDSAKNYVLRYVKNSAVESFTNLRMQNVTYGTLQLLDSLCGSGVIDTIWKSGDTLKYRIGTQTVTVGVFQNGASTDTTSLSNRINLKLNISDTSSMLSPYLRSNLAAATYQPIGNYLVSGSHGSLQSLTITGTNGNGNIHLRHQSSLPTATGQSTVIYANSNGDFAYKNDGNYHTTFVTSANTADRSYTFQNKSYTVADNAEVVKYTDTASMLDGRISSITLNTSGAIHTTPITFSRVGGAWSGTMSLTTQSVNRVFAGPSSGSAATPTFRALVEADMPNDYARNIDTIALASFGAGSGASGDTAAFSTSAVYGSFYNDGSDTLIITQMRAGVLGTSPSITTEIYWNDSLNITAGATILVSGGTSVTGTIGATNVTSFTNNKIPPGNWVFCRTSAVATKPTYLTLTLIGYKKRK